MRWLARSCASRLSFSRNSVSNVGFSPDGSSIEFDAPDEEAAALSAEVLRLGNQVTRTLRNLQRKTPFTSAAAAQPKFSSDVSMDGIHFLGTAQVALYGTPLRLFQYFDRVFEAFGQAWKATPLRTPTLIPSKTLSRCDYFRSFPHNFTFASHLREDAKAIDGFRKRHQTAEDIDEQALADMERPDACFLPAVCYHVYHLHENQTLPAQGLVYGICGKCFRYESSNLSDLRWLERGAIDIGKVVVPAEICGGHSAVHDRDEDCGQCNRSRVLAHSSLHCTD